MYEIYLWLLVLVMSVFLGGVFSVFFKGVGRKLIAGLCFFMVIFVLLVKVVVPFPRVVGELEAESIQSGGGAKIYFNPVCQQKKYGSGMISIYGIDYRALANGKALICSGKGTQGNVVTISAVNNGHAVSELWYENMIHDERYAFVGMADGAAVYEIKLGLDVNRMMTYLTKEGYRVIVDTNVGPRGEECKVIRRIDEFFEIEYDCYGVSNSAKDVRGFDSLIFGWLSLNTWRSTK